MTCEKYVYGSSELLADAPEADQVAKEGDTLANSFVNGQRLHIEGADFLLTMDSPVKILLLEYK